MARDNAPPRRTSAEPRKGLWLGLKLVLVFLGMGCFLGVSRGLSPATGSTKPGEVCLVAPQIRLIFGAI